MLFGCRQRICMAGLACRAPPRFARGQRNGGSCEPRGALRGRRHSGPVFAWKTAARRHAAALTGSSTSKLTRVAKDAWLRARSARPQDALGVGEGAWRWRADEKCGVEGCRRLQVS